MASGYVSGTATFVEVLAGRLFYALNCCSYRESLLVTALRPVGWGCRLAFYLVSVLFLVMALARNPTPLFEYTFSRERSKTGELQNDESDIFEFAVVGYFWLWVATIVTELLTYLTNRAGYAKADEHSVAFPFFFLSRSALPASDSRCGLFTLLLVVYLAVAAAATIMMHTIIAHLFVIRSMWFAILLAIVTAMQSFAGIADALSLGGPDGIASKDRLGAWLASVRVVLLLPILVIWTAGFVYMCNPP
jgi:hypothetical protein